MRPTRYQKKILADLHRIDPDGSQNLKKVINGWIYTDNYKYANEYTGISRYRYYFKIFRGHLKAHVRLLEVKAKGECYIGPFIGEFGNFLSFILPFLTYLHSKGIKVHYCGMQLYKPFMYDENRQLIVRSFDEVRDFLYESTPNGNSGTLPGDVELQIRKFTSVANKSGLPYWDLANDYFYWYIFRYWIKPYMKTPDLKKIYKSADDRSVVIFPRKKDVEFNTPYGEPWDFKELTEAVSPYFEKVYLLGHPAQSIELASKGNIEVLTSTDNRVLLEKCSNASLIITQHSGTKYLGELTNTQVLVIYKGKFPIFGMLDNIMLNYRLGKKYPWHFAFSLEQVKSYCMSFSKSNERN
jgi:hypothetical protein